MKNLTPWNNNDVKAPAGWTPTAPNQSQWTNNVTKNPTQYTVAGRNLDAWNPNTAANQAYQYDSPDMTYDSPLWFYNSLVNNNTLNQRGVTQWAAN